MLFTPGSAHTDVELGGGEVGQTKKKGIEGPRDLWDTWEGGDER